MSDKYNIGVIEAGGTKFNCAFGHSHDHPLETLTLKTTNPAATREKVFAFFDRCATLYGPLQGIGLACFGPVDLDTRSPQYGYILDTPKASWAYTDIVGPLESKYRVPVGFDTDVNGAALGEWRLGAGQGFTDVTYVTVGTGIGVGAIINGRPVHGLIHPEMGHIEVQKRRGEAPGICPSHSNCLEGFASGPALEKRWGAPPASFASDHMVWESEADYLARLCTTITLAYSPYRIIMGGGVMKAPGLLQRIRRNLERRLDGYLPTVKRVGGIENYVVAPALGEHAAIAGAFELARQQMDAAEVGAL